MPLTAEQFDHAYNAISTGVAVIEKREDTLNITRLIFYPPDGVMKHVWPGPDMLHYPDRFIFNKSLRFLLFNR